MSEVVSVESFKVEYFRRDHPDRDFPPYFSLDRDEVELLRLRMVTLVSGN